MEIANFNCHFDWLKCPQKNWDNIHIKKRKERQINGCYSLVSMQALPLFFEHPFISILVWWSNILPDSFPAQVFEFKVFCSWKALLQFYTRGFQSEMVCFNPFRSIWAWSGLVFKFKTLQTQKRALWNLEHPKMVKTTCFKTLNFAFATSNLKCFLTPSFSAFDILS